MNQEVDKQYVDKRQALKPSLATKASKEISPQEDLVRFSNYLTWSLI